MATNSASKYKAASRNRRLLHTNEKPSVGAAFLFQKSRDVVAEAFDFVWGGFQDQVIIFAFEIAFWAVFAVAFLLWRFGASLLRRRFLDRFASLFASA